MTRTQEIVKELKGKLLEIQGRDGRRLTEVIIHDSYVLPGWAFIVDKWDRIFLVLGSKDFDTMLAGTPRELAVFAIPELFDVPVTIDEDNRTAQVMNGVYLWAMETYKPTPPPKEPVTDVYTQ